MKRTVQRFAMAAALAGIGLSGDVMAWGSDGHRAVAAMAGQLIRGSHAEQQVAALLLPGESLEQAANWADCVKGTFCGPQTAEMQAYTAAHPRHGAFHYTDVPFQLEHYRDHAVGTADDDIVQTLKQAIAVLQGRADGADHPQRFTRRQALLLVTHLVGDIHQPLHVGAAYVGKDGGFVLPERRGQVDAVNMFDARGGNNLLLDDARLGQTSARLIPPPLPRPADEAPAWVPPKSPTLPFHSYWDTTVVDYAFRRSGVRTPLQFAQAMIAARPAITANTGDPVSWPYQWADDGLAVARLAYADATPGAIARQTGRNGDVYDVWGLTVPDDYPVPSSAIARTQLTKGGYHLAALLQAIWP
jgi:hypothetical protein